MTANIKLSLNEEKQTNCFQKLADIFNIILCFVNFLKSKLSEFKIYRMKSVIYILDILETSYTFIDERKLSQNENLNLNNYFRLCQSLQTALFGLLVFSNGKDEMEIEEKLFFKQGKFTPNLHGFPEANFF